MGGRHVVDPAAIDEQLTGGDVFQAGDQPQQGRFAATGRANENYEFAVGHVEVDAFDDPDLAESLADSAQMNISHVGMLRA